MRRLFRLGLTGGIAAGKSTVASRWREAGAFVIETDELAHNTLAPGTPTHDEIVRVFGNGILNADKSINRAVLGEQVFGDDLKRQRLNQIVHPVVRRMWTDALARQEGGQRAGIALVVIPLLYETGAETELDCVVTVGCSEQTQFARLAAKGLTAAQTRARIQAQWPMQKKMDKADYVIWNDGLFRVLAEQADRIWANIKENNHGPQNQSDSKTS
jgi:dephospho-CoA kinase